jgi:hypothetical protein
MIYDTELVLERAIDLFLANLPDNLAQYFELDSELYFVVENLTPWDSHEATILILECPEPDVCKLMIRNLQKVAHAAATCGIRYFSIDECGDDGVIFQSFFDLSVEVNNKN